MGFKCMPVFLHKRLMAKKRACQSPEVSKTDGQNYWYFDYGPGYENNSVFNIAQWAKENIDYFKNIPVEDVEYYVHMGTNLLALTKNRSNTTIYELLKPEVGKTDGQSYWYFRYGPGYENKHSIDSIAWWAKGNIDYFKDKPAEDIKAYIYMGVDLLALTKDRSDYDLLREEVDKDGKRSILCCKERKRTWHL